MNASFKLRGQLSLIRRAAMEECTCKSTIIHKCKSCYAKEVLIDIKETVEFILIKLEVMK